MNKERIIIMSKLAVYDKNYGEKDKAAAKFFRTDYVYRKNMWARFYVFAGCLMTAALYALRVFVVDGYDFFGYDYAGTLMSAGALVLAVMVAYTLIGTKIYVSEYNRSVRRLGNYLELIKLLNDMSGTSPVRAVTETESELEEPERGADLYYTRNDSELL